MTVKKGRQVVEFTECERSGESVDITETNCVEETKKSRRDWCEMCQEGSSKVDHLWVEAMVGGDLLISRKSFASF